MLRSRNSRKQIDYWTLMGPKFSKKERAQMNLSRFPFFTQTKEQDRCHVHSDPMSIRGQAFLRPGDTGESRPCKSCPASRTGIHAAIALRLAADSAAKGLQGGSRGQYNQQRRVDTPLHTQEVTGSSPVAPTIRINRLQPHCTAFRKDVRKGVRKRAASGRISAIRGI